MPDVTFAPQSDTGYMKNIPFVVKAQQVLDKKLIGLGIDAFEAAPIKGLTIGKDVIGLPYAPSTIMLYYNKDAFKAAGLNPEQPPRTLKELGEYSAKLTQKDAKGTITRYGFAYTADSWVMSSWIGQQNTAGKGYSLFGNNNNGHDAVMTKVQFDTDGTMKKFLTEYAKAVEIGSIKFQEDDRKNNFAAGSITMTLDSSAGCRAMQELTAGKFALGVANLPMMDESSTGGVAAGGSALYPIDKGDKAKLAAVYEYLKYLYSPEMQLEWHSGTGYLAAIPATYKTDAYKKFIAENPLFAVGVAQLQASNPNISEPMCGVGGAISTAVKNGIISVLDKTATIDKAVATMASICNQALEDYNLANP